MKKREACWLPGVGALFACPVEGTQELALSGSPIGASCGGPSLALPTHSDGLIGLQGTSPLE